MEQEQINRLMAAKETIQYCENTSTATAASTTFAPKVAFIKGKIVLVEGFIQNSDEPIEGVRVDQDTVRALMIDSVLPVASGVYGYASNITPTPDETLMGKAHVARSTLEKCSKSHCATECRRLVTLGQANAVNIAPYGIDATALSDADAAVTLFEGLITNTGIANANRKDNGVKAQEGLNKIMDTYLAKQLDAMAAVFRYSDPSWFRQYRFNREIKDLGHTFTKLRVDTHDVEGDPIKGVNVTMSQGGVVKYSGKTDAGGELHIVKVEPGNYDIKYEKTGFITQTEADYHFAPGSEKIHHILMTETAGFPGDPPGFDVQEFHIPQGGTMLSPFGPNVPPTTQIYLLSNGNATICTTNLPAVPCVSGYALIGGTPYLGPVSGLSLDLTKDHLQIMNTSPSDITVRAGTPI